MSDLMSAVGLLVGVWSLAMLTAHPGGDRTHPDDVLEAELNRLATNVVRSAARAKRPLTLVSVLAFEERGRGPTQAGEYVADLFDEILAKKNINRVARNPSSERAMWSELCHSTEGHTSDATAVSIGKRQAARYVIHGIMTKLNDRWRVRAKVLQVESSRVIVNQSVKVPGAAFGDHLLAPLDPRITDCVGTDEASTSIVRSTNRGGGQNGDGRAGEFNSQREPRPPITLEVGVMKWGGFAGGIYYNGGLDASRNSRFFKEHGILVRFKLLDSIKDSIAWWRRGENRVLWITVDDLPTEYPLIRRFAPKLIMQAAWSRGEEVLIVRKGIETLNDLAGRTVAFEPKTTAHSFLLASLDVAALPFSSIKVAPAKNSRDACRRFAAGADAAIVWVPADKECLGAVDGAYKLESTADASYLIAESLMVKDALLRRARPQLSRFVRGWLTANAQINRSKSARRTATRLLAEAFRVSDSEARRELSLVRLATLGDNRNFFGLNKRYRGETGSDLYRYFVERYRSTNYVEGSLPQWNALSDRSIVERLSLTGRAHRAESSPSYDRCQKARDHVSNAPTSFAKKPVNVVFASNRHALSRSAKRQIDQKFGHLAEIFLADCIRIDGNTDNRGARAHNLRLSLKRAYAVRDYLVQRYGFDRRRFICEGHGPDDPVASNDTKKGRALNRRTDMELLH